ncbi:hypothetical protein AGMMS50268_05940 [Spirochaetia bacterium]|nr:hypothetical protein AGMMS50268_05940 [Spirochaetia bacterium]
MKNKQCSIIEFTEPDFQQIGSAAKANSYFGIIINKRFVKNLRLDGPFNVLFLNTMLERCLMVSYFPLHVSILLQNPKKNSLLPQKQAAPTTEDGLLRLSIPG